MFRTHSDPRFGKRSRRRRRSTIALFVALLSLSLLTVASTSAAPTLRRIKVPSATLKQVDKPELWQGVVGPEDAPTAGVPTLCAAVTCDHFQIELALPAGTFSDPEHPGGLQVALRWMSEFDALNLYVYKDGEIRAADASINSTAQSVLLANPENGIYDVWIASVPSWSLEQTVAYEALAEVQFAPAVHPIRELLPDLELRSIRTITFRTPSFPLFEPDPPPGSSCFVTEMAVGAQTCLRFDHVLANVGQGPLELRFAIPLDPGDSSINVLQRVYASDGSYDDQPGGKWEFHTAHGHFHYTSFAITYLFQSNRKGEQVSPNPIRTSESVSFCGADIEIDAWGLKGDGPHAYRMPDCLYPAYADGNYRYIVHGLTQGWADVHQWYLPDQYIEVSGVADGYYLMLFCADPDGFVEELDESNNCRKHLIQLLQMGTPQRSVINLGPVP